MYNTGHSSLRNAPVTCVGHPNSNAGDACPNRVNQRSEALLSTKTCLATGSRRKNIQVCEGSGEQASRLQPKASRRDSVGMDLPRIYTDVRYTCLGDTISTHAPTSALMPLSTRLNNDTETVAFGLPKKGFRLSRAMASDQFVVQICAPLPYCPPEVNMSLFCLKVLRIF